jgi:sigma-B regulation protein RsbU (phosphoserine phosphatase)
MSKQTKASPLRYVILAILFAIAVAFQVAISLPEMASLWPDVSHFRLDMLHVWVIMLNLHVLTPAACLLLGFYVAAVRAYDSKAWLLLAVLVSFSLISDGSDVHDRVMQWNTPLKHLALVYRSVVIMSWPLFMLVFAIYFPDRAEFDRRRPWLKWIALVPALIVYFLVVLTRIADNENLAAFSSVAGMAHNLVRPVTLEVLLFLSLLIFAGRLAKAEDFDERRRLRVLLSGLAISFVPAILLEAIGHRMMHMNLQHEPVWLSLAVYGAVMLFPVTLAYVTVVQRAMDVRVILRQSLQYALARRGLVLIQILVSLLIVLLVALYSGRMTFSGRAALTGCGLAVVLMIGNGARKLAGWIDRRFFREAYNREQILARLADSVSSIVELSALLTTVATRIADALHISGIAIFLSEQKRYRLAYALGYIESRDNVSFPDESPTVEQLQREKKPLLVYPDDPRSWPAKIDGREREELERLDSRLLLPLARREELLGFLSLGPRYSEAPYSTGDVRLLQSVAQQTALAVENSRLTSTIAAETAQREVMMRELSIAREVQQRLLPQTAPVIAGIECFGTVRPAREVGGDYYDFLELPNHALGLAIGDVSGKGIPASLLMASLQASLRSQALGAEESLEKLMCNVNRLVYAASPINLYATFFYAQYDPEFRRLTYVNAGHNAPIVLQRNDGKLHITRLDVGGLPVGMLTQLQYQSSRVDLQGGDLAVFFTDGITEAMNTREEEWGEENLLRTLRDLDPSGSPEKIVRAVFRSADEFAGDAPQHDDMTLVVLAVR